MSTSWRRWSILAILTIVATAILAKDLTLETPLMAGDEYGYFAPVQTFPDLSARFAVDPYLPRYYSPAFTVVGTALSRVSQRPEVLLKVVHTAGFVGIVLVFLALSRALARGGPRPLTAAVFMLLPSSAYTAYFMPEMTYTFLFALLSWVVAIIFPARMLSGAVLSGVVVGTMLLTKPHALALFLGTFLTLAALFVAPSSIRPARRRLLALIPLFMLSSYVTVVCMNGVIARRLELSPLAFVGAIYVPYFARDLSAVSLLGKLPRLLAILGGHLIVFGTFVALGAARGGAELRRLYTTRTALDNGDRVRFLLIVFTGCATLWTIAMTVYFTAQATNVVPTDYFRLHGRYYSFVIPLYLVLFFGLSRDSAEADANDSWLLTGTIIGCGLSVLLYYVASRRTIYPFDYPEATVFSGWHGAPGSGLATLSVDAVTHIGIGIALVGYVVMLWRRHLARVVYPILLIALFSVSTARVTAWQRTNSIKNAGLRADARSMRKLLAVSERDNGLVVGPEWNGRLAYFLFNFGSSAHVLVRPAGSDITTADLPVGTRWVVLLGAYTPAFPAGAAYYTPRTRLIRVAAGGA